jgi:hypothetical protein
MTGRGSRLSSNAEEGEWKWCWGVEADWLAAGDGSWRVLWIEVADGMGGWGDGDGTAAETRLVES